MKQVAGIPSFPSEIKKKILTPWKITKNVDPSEIFLSQPPSEISTWHPLRNSEFQTPSENVVSRGGWILNGMALFSSLMVLFQSSLLND